MRASDYYGALGYDQICRNPIRMQCVTIEMRQMRCVPIIFDSNYTVRKAGEGAYEYTRYVVVKLVISSYASYISFICVLCCISQIHVYPACV